MILTDYTLNIHIEIILKLQTREFEHFWGRIEGNRAFGNIDTADMYVVRVCEISFFLKRNSHEFCIRQILHHLVPADGISDLVSKLD